MASGELVRTITLSGWWGKQPVYSPDGTLLAVPINNAIGLFEVATGKRWHHGPETPVGGVHACSWSAAGDRIVTGHDDGFVRIRNAVSGELIWAREFAPAIVPGGRNSSPAFVAFTPDGESIVIAGSKDARTAYRDGLVVVCDAATGNTQREMSLKAIRNGALGRDGKTVVAATSFGSIGDTRLHGFDVATGRKIFVAPPEDQKIGLWDAKVMRFRPDSQTLLVATGGGDIYQFDAATGQERRRVRADYRTPEQKQTGRPREPQLWSGAFSDDGRTLVSCSEAWVYVWDVDTGDLLTGRLKTNPKFFCGPLALL